MNKLAPKTEVSAFHFKGKNYSFFKNKYIVPNDKQYLSNFFYLFENFNAMKNKIDKWLHCTEK